MNDGNSPKLESIVKEYCKKFTTAIDIGCATGVELFTLENLGFSKLIGIEIKENTYDYFRNYFQYTLNKNKSQFPNKSELEKIFTEKYSFHISNCINYTYENSTYSYISCHKVLHFLPFEEQSKLILRLYDLLEPGGIFSIQINHNLNPFNTNPQTTNLLAVNTYQNKFNSSEIMYLVDPKEFEVLISNFPRIGNRCFLTDSFVGAILTKN